MLFQNVRKLATSRLITPAIAAGSRRRHQTYSSSSPVSSTNTSSSEAGRIDGVLGDDPVRRPLGADDRDGGAGGAHGEPRRLGLARGPRPGGPAARRPPRSARRRARGSARRACRGRSPAPGTSARPRRRGAPPPRCSGWTSGSSCPRERRSPTRSQTCVRICGSRPTVGSSSRTSFGSWTSPRASSRRLRMPPESSSTASWRRSVSRASASARSTAAPTSGTR